MTGSINIPRFCRCSSLSTTGKERPSPFLLKCLLHTHHTHTHTIYTHRTHTHTHTHTHAYTTHLLERERAPLFPSFREKHSLRRRYSPTEIAQSHMIQFNNLQYKSHDNRGIPFENWHNGAAPVQMSEDIPQTCVVLCVCGEEGVQRWWEEGV